MGGVVGAATAEAGWEGGQLNDNPQELADEAVALRLIADALYARSKDLTTRAAAAMGRGSLFPRLPDGTELGSFVIPKGSTTVSFDVDLLLPFVKKEYPDEVVETVRPSFLEAVRQLSRQQGRPAAPMGELDFPGVYVTVTDAGAPRITGYDAGKERAQAAVDSVLDNVLATFAVPALPGGSE